MAASGSSRWPRKLVLLVGGLAAPLTLAEAPSTPDLVEQTRTAVANLDRSKNAAHRFTNFDLAHNQNRNSKGKLYSDTTTLYEDTWIADLPFKRLVEVNGHPLAGRELEKEQRRFDNAVQDRRALDDAARARLVHEQFMDAGLDLQALTTPIYRLTRLREEAVDGHNTTVIDASPDPTPSPAAPNHYTLWITSEDPALLQLAFETLADTPRLLRGSHGEKAFLLLDGVSLPAHTTIHALVPAGHETVTVDTVHTYSRYRRFSATSRILPAGETPAGPQM